MSWAGLKKRTVYRNAGDQVERLPELAAELVRLHVDVIIAMGTLAPLAAQQVTSTIPIVMTAAGDPIWSGLVASLARPGGNVTGLSSLNSSEFAAKRVQMLKELLPQLSRLAFLRTTSGRSGWSEEVARTLGIKVTYIFGLEIASKVLAQEYPDALIVNPDPIFFGHRKEIADIAARNGLPSIYGSREYAEAGGLMSYGPDEVELQRRAASYVDRILRGAKPNELPVEQPTKFERRVGEDVGTLTPHGTGRADFPLPVLHGRASLTQV
jgi:putative tryptophan/tyrosine transport system substrate-binding protein